MLTPFSNLIKDQSGVTAIEYALIAALIAVAAIAAFTLVGTNLSTTSAMSQANLTLDDRPRRQVTRPAQPQPNRDPAVCTSRRWQATWWPGRISRISGSSFEQRAKA